MKKIIYSALAALSIFAFASCDTLSGTDNDSDGNNNDPNEEVNDPKDPNEEILAGYYKPLIGKWNVTKYYGTQVDEFGVEKPFDFSSGYENNLYYDTFEFEGNNMMTKVSHIYFNDKEDSHYEDTYEVVFRIDVPNFFRAEILEGSTYLDYEIVKVTDSTLHLKEYASNATSHFECVRIR